VNKGRGEAIGMNSIVEAMRGQAVEALLLIPSKGIEGYLFTVSPGLEVGKEGCEVSTLNARLGGDLARREDRVLRKVGEQASVEPGKGGTKEEVATTDPAIVGQLQRGPAFENDREG
jgi:hypothetical protein